MGYPPQPASRSADIFVCGFRRLSSRPFLQKTGIEPRDALRPSALLLLEKISDALCDIGEGATGIFAQPFTETFRDFSDVPGGRTDRFD
jgi:hypothetical protein